MRHGVDKGVAENRAELFQTLCSGRARCTTSDDDFCRDVLYVGCRTDAARHGTSGNYVQGPFFSVDRAVHMKQHMKQLLVTSVWAGEVGD